MSCSSFLQSGCTAADNSRCSSQMPSSPKSFLEDHLKCPPALNSSRTKCPLCGTEGSPEHIQMHVGTCGIETMACEQCGEMLHRGIMAYHTQYVCTRRLVFCNSCATNVPYDTFHRHQRKCSAGRWQAGDQTGVNKGSMARARSSDTFDHTLSSIGSNSPTVDPQCGNTTSSGGLIQVGYGSLLSKMDNSDLTNHKSFDEHSDSGASSTIVSCMFHEAGCQFRGTRLAVGRHIEDSAKLHLTLSYNLIQQQQKQLLMLTSALANMNPNTDGSIIWKVKHFSEKLLDAKSGKRMELHSPVFYTSRFGYKMCLILYPDGCATSQGSHVSLYLRILKGEHDMFLAWPFPYTVKIVLLSQDNSRQHLVHRVNYKFSHDSSPTAALGNNVFGVGRFAAQETVLSSHQFLVDDTLCICATAVTDLNNNSRQPEIFPRTSEI